MKPSTLFNVVSLTLVFGISPVRAAVLLADEFNDNVPTTGASPNLVGAWTFQEGTQVETGGSITLSTFSGGYSEANMRTAVSSQLNFFTTAIRMEGRGFSQVGTGDFSTVESFRVGLVARTGTTGGLNFYGSDDAVALRISNDAQTFEIGYKFNSTNTSDPSSFAGMNATTGARLGTLGFTITGFDFTVSGTTWEAIFYGAGGESSINRGTWLLGESAADWGNATEGVGNSAVNMYAQASAPTGTVGNSSFTLGSFSISTVPEPSRGLMVLGAGMSLFMRRRRI